MLSIIGAILALLWVLGVATSYTLNGFIHLLLILAVALPIIQWIKTRGQRTSQADHASRIHLEDKATP